MTTPGAAVLIGERLWEGGGSDGTSRCRDTTLEDLMAARTAAQKHRRRLQHERADLESTLKSLQDQLRSLVDEGREVAESDFSEEGGDPDGGVVERDRVRARIADTEEHLRQVDKAEAAIEDGTYGTCHVCGSQVPEERLDALPWTTLCVQCKAAGHSN